MEGRQFTRDYDIEAVKLIRDRGESYILADGNLVSNPTPPTIRDMHFLPGQMKQEITRLRREVVKLKAERDIQNEAAASLAKETM